MKHTQPTGPSAPNPPYEFYPFTPYRLRGALRVPPGTSLQMSIFVLLVAIALLLAVCSLIFPNYPLLGVAVILLCVSLLIGKTG